MNERALTAARTDLARLERPQGAQTSIAQAHPELRAKLADWRGLLRAHVPQARQMVRKLIEGRIEFHAEA